MGKLYLQDTAIKELLIDSTNFQEHKLQPASYDIGLNINSKFTLKANQNIIIQSDFDVKKLNDNNIFKNDIYFEIASKSTPARLDILVVPIIKDDTLFLSLTSRSFNIEITKDTLLAQIKFYTLTKKKNVTKVPLFIDITKDFFGHVASKNIDNSINYEDNLSSSRRIYYTKMFNCEENFPYIKFEPNQLYLINTSPIIMSSNQCGQIIDFDQSIFDGQIHTAGFVDPGFKGSIVLEIRALSNIKFDLREPIGYMHVNDLVSKPEITYSTINNNYQNQTTGLPKQFI